MIAPGSNPKIRALARETSQKIKALTNAHDAEIAAIYQDFRTQADAIKAETSGDELHHPTAGSVQTTHSNKSQGLTTLCPNQVSPQPKKP